PHLSPTSLHDALPISQFQYSLEDVDAKELAYWTPRFIDKLKSLPELRDVASDQLNQGLLASLTIDRDTAARLGILPADIDNTLRSEEHTSELQSLRHL